MSDNSESNQREVFIVKKNTTMTSEEYISIQLKSPDESIESLLQKALVATNTKQALPQNNISHIS